MIFSMLDCFSLATVDIVGQKFDVADISVIGILILLEGILSIDNALVLGLLAKRLPPHQRKKALTYGLVGAFAFRFIAILTATILLKLPFMKLLGGGYLIYIAIKHFLFDSHNTHDENIRLDEHGHPVLMDETGQGDLSPAEREREISQRSPLAPNFETGTAAVRYASFWPTVIVIELTDIAFAIDSILAALAFIPPSVVTPNPKLWVIITGGMLGVILMRYAAVMFIRLLERFPRFETSAYLLVIVIGLKLCLDWYFNARPPELPPDQVFHGPLDFHSARSPAFWVFWAMMLICFCIGFLPQKRKSQPAPG